MANRRASLFSGRLSKPLPPHNNDLDESSSKYSYNASQAGRMSKYFSQKLGSVFDDRKSRSQSNATDLSTTDMKSPPVKVSVSLVGIEHAGKSTFYKQVTSMFTPEDFNQLLWTDAKSQAMGSLLKITFRILKQALPELVTIEAKRSAQTLLSIFPAYTLTTESAAAVKQLWSDVIFLSFYRTSAYYAGQRFINEARECERLLDRDFEMSKEFHLLLHNQTKGYNSTSFRVKDRLINLWDVGGDWGQRSDWEYFLRKSNVVLFLASLSDYASYSDDGDEPENSLYDSMQMFKVLCESEFLQSSKIFIVLTKFDVFKDRLLKQRVELNKSGYFPDAPSMLSGATKEESVLLQESVDYIKEQYLKLTELPTSFLKRDEINFLSVSSFDEQQVREVVLKCAMSVEDTNSGTTEATGSSMGIAKLGEKIMNPDPPSSVNDSSMLKKMRRKSDAFKKGVTSIARKAKDRNSKPKLVNLGANMRTSFNSRNFRLSQGTKKNNKSF